MKIINLMEDTAGETGCLFEHGLSFYIETGRHKLLLDTGATGAFLENAEKRGVDLTSVDTVVISHGHYDHAGGVLSFVERNPHATIYIHKNAVGEFYNLKNGQTKYIGMDKKIPSLPQVVFVDGAFAIDEGLTLFGGGMGRRLWPKGNAVLKRRTEAGFVQDEFDHEQYLVVTEGERRVLLSGCAHNGILNILDAFRDRFGGEPTHVVSGFHTTKQVYTQEDEALLYETAAELGGMNTVFYTGHCTGEHPMEVFRQALGHRLVVLHSGDTVLDL